MTEAFDLSSKTDLEELQQEKQFTASPAGGSANDDEDVPDSSTAKTDRMEISPKVPVEVATTSTGGIITDASAYSNQVDLVHMKDAVYFLLPDKSERLSRFWILLVLAALIATSGVVSDSAATVIGAMIVAPLMTPILGTMLSIVLLDRDNFLFSIMLCLAGVGTCIFLGYLYGLCINDDIIMKENNSQVAGRVQPRLSDLVGAIATGAVGAIALVRKDIGDALPGVAISISLVPPLCVAGLMGSIGELTDMFGALLLFITNFMSIQVTGIIVMYAYKVNQMALRPNARSCRSVFLVLLVMLGLVAVPLAFSSKQISAVLEAENCVEKVTNEFLAPRGWECSIVVSRMNGNRLSANVAVSGPMPIPQVAFKEGNRTFSLEEIDGNPYINALIEECPEVDTVQIKYVPGQTIELGEP